jgi:hypothetical protein
MERVAFLMEKSGARIPCLLNPESVVVRRLAGVRPRQSSSGPLTGTGLKDDPLHYTGGGTTEINLDLLFDVSIAGSSINTADVRDLTRPLWELAEGTSEEDGSSHPPLVRFVWGKAWNIPGIVVAVAERLENFAPDGAPERSWMRMRLLRRSEPVLPGPESPALGPSMPVVTEGAPLGEAHMMVHELGEGSREGGPPVRLDAIAQQYCGYPWWKPVAQLNNIDDPARVPAGTLLRMPREWMTKEPT